MVAKFWVLRLFDSAKDDYPVISLEGEAEGVAEAQGQCDFKLAPCVSLDTVSLDGFKEFPGDGAASEGI